MPCCEFDSPNWYTYKNTHFNGDIIIDGEHFNGRTACIFFEDIKSIARLRDLLNQVSGSFAVITTIENCKLIIPDQIASMKIYYSVDGSNISDSFEIINGQISSKNFDLYTGLEFLLSGYVPGPDTLHPNIKKTRPGEFVILDTKNGEIKTERYYKFEATLNQKNKPKETVFRDLNSKLSSIFSNIDIVFGDLPIILSLSDGFDSRLMAHALRNTNADVYTFTYSYNSKDSYVDTAESIAESFGYPWKHFVHTNEEVNELYSSDKYKSLELSVGGEGTIHPKPSTLISLQKISEDDFLPDNGVILEGHTIAEAGKKLLFSQPNTVTRSLEEEISHLVDKNFYRKNTNTNIKTQLQDRMRKRIDMHYPDVPIPEKQMSEIWYWDQRLPNRLLIPRRIYQFFGYDTWYPFCDREYLDFYMNLQPEYRYKRKLYEEYVIERDKAQLKQIFSTREQRQSERIKEKLKTLIKQTPIEQPARKLKQTFETKKSPQEIYKEEAGFGIMSESDFETLYTGSEGPRYYLALFALAKSNLDPRSDFPNDFGRQYQHVRKMSDLSSRTAGEESSNKI